MSFTARLSTALKKADAVEFDGMVVFCWYPLSTGEIKFEYGEDADMPEEINVRDQEVMIDGDGKCKVVGPDLEAEIPLDDDSEPTKNYTVTMLKYRPLTLVDLA